MCQPLPTGNFQWDYDVEKYTPQYIKNLDWFATTGYSFCVDLEYPEELHDLHNEFPLAPCTIKVTEDYLSNEQIEQAKKLGIKIGVDKKLCCTLEDKKFYHCHYW